MKTLVHAFLVLVVPCALRAFVATGRVSESGAGTEPWIPDLGDGRYRNPVIYADYSDPDVVRVGEDYWMTSSSFTDVPGLPLLHSHDLVNWTLVGHALPRLVPEEMFATPRHGKGVWAPSIRFHAGKYWIYYPDPDFGIYVTTAADPRGPWSAPQLVLAGKGLIDPCPLWDEDGSVYLIHAWAKSRAGINNVLTLRRLDASGTRAEEDFGVVIDGHTLPNYSTLEGPKLYKRDGWYYVFAPAGGVKTGWQSVFRARDIRGPYEARIVLAQGNTPVNGPHQGALVDTPGGEWWFLHFQDRDAYGRIVHLQPVQWRDGWPVIGDDPDGDGVGQPVLVHRKPALPPQPLAAPSTSDEFASSGLGVQWQWPANPRAEFASLCERPGLLRFHVQPTAQPNLRFAPYLLLQKLPAPDFSATTEVELDAKEVGARASLILLGETYAWIGVRRAETGFEIARSEMRGGGETGEEQRVALPPGVRRAQLRVTVSDGARCRFSYRAAGEKDFTVFGDEFVARPGRWVGAKMGLFADAPRAGGTDAADFAWFHVEASGETD